MAEPISLVKAMIDFFGTGPHGRKLGIPEMKELSREDKIELREMLIGEGYTILELSEPVQS
jgi:hypothetical protein